MSKLLISCRSTSLPHVQGILYLVGYALSNFFGRFIVSCSIFWSNVNPMFVIMLGAKSIGNSYLFHYIVRNIIFGWYSALIFFFLQQLWGFVLYTCLHDICHEDNHKFFNLMVGQTLTRRFFLVSSQQIDIVPQGRKSQSKILVRD